MKITFKKDSPATGLSSVGSPNPDTNIKVDKLVVGTIAAPNWQTKDNLWSVRLTVAKEKTEDDPAPFRWITMKKRFASEPEAREFVRGHLASIVGGRNLELYQFPDGEI